jgi:hypothetical protein
LRLVVVLVGDLDDDAGRRVERRTSVVAHADFEDVFGLGSI